MSSARLHSPLPPTSEGNPDLGQLGRASRLLEDAQRSLARAGHEAERRSQELQQRIRELEESLGEMEKLLVRTEHQAAQLANLYVATYQLHASLEVSDVRAAIADIAVNLLGAERFTIWLKDETGQLFPAPEGAVADEAVCRAAYVGQDSLIDACLEHGSPQFGPCEGSELLVAVPFTRHGEAVGVLAVATFLRHKPGLSADDYELLDLMAAHAASALLAARAFHVSQRKLTAYEGLLGFLRGGGS
jgi:hypothetical protein